MEKRHRCHAIAREAGRATGATRHARRLGSRALLGRPRSRAIGDGQSGSEPSRARLGIGSDRAAAREPSNQERCERAPARELWMRCDRAPARERQKRCDRAPAREHRGQQPIRGQPGTFATERQRGSSRAYGPSPAPCIWPVAGALGADDGPLCVPRQRPAASSNRSSGAAARACGVQRA